MEGLQKDETAVTIKSHQLSRLQKFKKIVQGGEFVQVLIMNLICNPSETFFWKSAFT